MARIKCFFLEPTVEVAQWLRRYVWSTDKGSKCKSPDGYHNAMVRIENRVQPETSDGTIREGHANKADPRWPTFCPCGYIFGIKDEWQVFSDGIYLRRDTMERVALREAPAGAMWFADWMIHDKSTAFAGPDGHCLAVRTPGGDWLVDSRASNCTLPDDKEHKCWCRHGDPATGVVTVDKNGKTCSAGGGSIQSGKYHGFLRDGYLVDA